MGEKEKKLSEQQERNFEKYSIHYKRGDHSEERHERQKIAYEGLCKKEIGSTNIERLLDVTLQEIQHLETIKQHIEFKLSVMITILTVLLGNILQMGLFKKMWGKIIGKSEFERDLAFVFLLVCFIIGSLLVKNCYRVLSVRSYSTLCFDKENFESAVEDKKIALVAMLEDATRVVEDNRELNDKKAKDAQRIIILSLAFCICIVCMATVYY